MNPLSDKQLEKMLRSIPPAGDVDRAVQGVLAQAERDGLVDVAYAPVDSGGLDPSGPPGSRSSEWNTPRIHSDGPRRDHAR